MNKEIQHLAQAVKRYLQEQKYLDGEEFIIMNSDIRKTFSRVLKQPPEQPALVREPARPGSKKELMDIIDREIASCKKCPLHKSRIKTVPGEGSLDAKVIFIGEGPGYDEDHTGRPFIGRAGQLLTKIIESTGVKREDVFITNIVKCHPMTNPDKPESRGNDRPPSKEEISCCIPYLKRQIDIINPKIICTLGSPAGRTLLQTEEPIGRFRGKLGEFNGKKLLPTYHPAALLRDPAYKKPVWEDMKLLRKLI